MLKLYPNNIIIIVDDLVFISAVPIKKGQCFFCFVLGLQVRNFHRSLYLRFSLRRMEKVLSISVERKLYVLHQRYVSLYYTITYRFAYKLRLPLQKLLSVTCIVVWPLSLIGAEYLNIMNARFCL